MGQIIQTQPQIIKNNLKYAGSKFDVETTVTGTNSMSGHQLVLVGLDEMTKIYFLYSQLR